MKPWPLPGDATPFSVRAEAAVIVAALALALVALSSCDSQPATTPTAASPEPSAAEMIQTAQRAQLYQQGMNWNHPNAAPKGAPATVAWTHIKLSLSERDPSFKGPGCTKVGSAIRNPLDATIVATCTGGERWLVAHMADEKIAWPCEVALSVFRKDRCTLP